MLGKDIREKILGIQRNEITEHIIYKKLSSIIKEVENKKVLIKISNEEKVHYDFWKTLTQKDVSPDRLKIFLFVLVNRIFGITFGIKLMEKGEGKAQKTYETLKEISPQIEYIIREEDRHEQQLISLLDEERLKYVSSIVLGLNDALVELTGALVGFSLALQNTKLVGIVGLITGIAASMSMSASEYLSTKQEDIGKSPLKASVYTGFAYIGTVIILITPYFIFKNIFISLSFVIFNAILIIFLFTFYISIAKELSFRKRFLEMAGISLGIAFINFFIGLLVRKVFGIEM
ncbi:MAG: VIT1/CCC1 transporter family protein [Candidatus Omnitrophica bacterium]|nr:VIT1/CCC1 transporter family protein [Candidatus Omnitrophota bacterium]MCM8823589.1 VIT1/CCC1 transporter family protein [Candidatus Omnitrophota bacterium]MCM8826291.1 VIT1/CCC1 transporter family protein [Candidatus Omnitrophota bacterium]